MPIEPFQLVEDYGEAVLSGNAALFIGAGISQGAGLPGWGALLDPIRVGCNVPEHHDLPLVAEYIVNEAKEQVDSRTQQPTLCDLFPPPVSIEVTPQ